MRLTFLTLAISFVLSVSAFAQTLTRETLPKKNEVVWCMTSDIESFNPMISFVETDGYVQSEMYESLLSTNPRTQAFIPWLASLPTESADHLTYSFTMDAAAHWSDGKPLTAEDVVFSYKIACNPFVVMAAPLRGYFEHLDSCWIPAGHPNQVMMRWNKYRFDILKVINYVKIIPKHIWDVSDLTGKFSWADLRKDKPTNVPLNAIADTFQTPAYTRDPPHFTGSGPYIFEQWTTLDRITLARDRNYWAKDRPWADAYPDRIIFKIIMDQNAGILALKNGDVDIVPTLTATQYLDQFDADALRYINRDTVYYNAVSFVAWNNERPLFADKNVRKALTMLIDRDEILHTIYRDLAKKIDGPVAPSQPNFDPSVHQPGYNPKEAMRLLEKSGWADHDSDGMLDKMIDDKKVDFGFTFQIPSGNEITKKIALLIAAGLKKAGITMEIAQLEWTVYYNNLRNHQFDAGYASWVGNSAGSEGIEDETSQLWASSQSKNKGSNYYSYSNEDADKLMDAIIVEPDRAIRIAMSHKLQHIMTDDQPVTFMFTMPQRIAWLDRFDNFEFFPSRPPFDPRYWIVRGAGVTRSPSGVPMGAGRH